MTRLRMHVSARLVCFFLLVATAVAELPKETTIPVVDVSALDAPVKISGRVATKDQPTKTLRYSFETNVSIANVSTKPILLMVVKLEVISPYKIRLNYSEEDDFSFESKILQPSSVAKLERVSGPFGEPQGPYESVTFEPSATARVAYVQFLDGSTWGDATTAKGLLRDRQLSLDELETLAKIYRTTGEQGFLNKLLQPTVLQPIMTLQNLYRERKDLTSVLAKLDEMLQNARMREPPSGSQTGNRYAR